MHWDMPRERVSLRYDTTLKKQLKKRKQMYTQAKLAYLSHEHSNINEDLAVELYRTEVE